jgi:DNA mismatch repair protein MSH5
VLEQEEAITGASDLYGELDSLVALATAAEKYQWIAPQMTLSNIIDIVGGRHPLQELLVPSFIPNDCRIVGGPGTEDSAEDGSSASDGKATAGSSMLVLTGPNNSGKSVYMKQVALIVYLAHIGSYVPASQATIGVTDRILTRIATRETVTDDESAFLIDLKQAAFSINFATRRSLILTDEFGKGTNTETGAGLFAALLTHFLDLGRDRPKVLAGTHFHDVFGSGFLRPEDGVTLAHMGVRLSPEAEDPEDQITFLFQLRPGRDASSLGTVCAAINGVEREVVERAEALVLLQERNEDLVGACTQITEEDIRSINAAEMIARRFLAMDIPRPGAGRGELGAVRSMLHQVIFGDPDSVEL